MKRRLALGVALAAFFLYLSLRKVNLAETWEVLKRAKLYSLAGLAVFNLVGLWFRSLRWSYLLRPITDVKPRRLLPPLCIGLMANMIVPAPRAGEFIRAYLVGRNENVSKSATFATVVVERIFDGLAIISFMALAPLFLKESTSPMASRLQWVGLVVFACYVALFLFLLAMSHHREALHRFLYQSWPVRRWKLARRAAEMLEKFTEGLAILKSTGEVFGALALSLLIWGIVGGINYLMMYSVGLRLPVYAAFFLVVIQSFGVMVPSPGFLGSYQYAHIVALGVYGVAESDAFGLGVLIHAGFFVVFVLTGLFFLLREDMSWGDLKEASKEGGGGGPTGADSP